MKAAPIAGRWLLGLALATLLLFGPLSLALAADKLLHADFRHRPPEMIVEGEQISGPLKEILEQAAALNGYDVQWRVVPFSQSLEGLRDGTVDIVPRTIRRTDRESFVDFAGPLDMQKKEIVFLVHKGEEGKIQSFEDLHSLKVGVKPKTAYFDRFDRDEAIEKLSLDGDFEMVRAFIDGRVDTVATLDRPPLESALVGLGFADYSFATYRHTLTIGNYYGVSKKTAHPGLFAALDQTLNEMVSDGLVNEIYRKYDAADAARSTERVRLTLEERQWLLAHPTWTVANELDWPPFDFAEHGDPMGLSIDMIRAIAEKVGAKLKFTNGFTWTELVERFNAGEIDILPAVYLTPERQTTMLFTSPYASNASVLVTHESNEALTGLDGLKGKTVAVIEGFATADIMRERYPDIRQFPVKNVKEGLQEVSFGRVDAFIGSLGVISHVLDETVIPNIRFVDEVWLKRPEESELHIGVLKHNRIMRDILQKGLDALTNEERRRLREKWVPLRSTQGNQTQRVPLTPEEARWLEQHPRIRLGDDFSWPPFSFLDNQNKYSGISSGYMEALSERLGIEIQPLYGLSWTQVLDGLKGDGVDISPAMSATPEREKFLNFTKPYITFPVVIATRKEGEFFSSLKDLSGRSLGVIKGYVTHELIGKDYPDIHLVPFANLSVGLRALSEGKLDAFADNLGAITYEVDRQKLENVKIAAPTEYAFPLSIGVRKDWPELVGILNKALDSIDDREKAAIQNAWMALQVEFGLDLATILTWVLPVAGGVIAVFAVVVVWNRKLNRQVEERHEAEQRTRLLLESVGEGIFGVDQDGRVTFVNSVAAEDLGFTPLELIGQKVHALIHHTHTDGTDYPLEDCPMWAAYTRGISARIDNEVLWRKDGTSFPVEYNATPLWRHDALVGAVISFRDTTEAHEARETLHEHLAEVERFNALAIDRELRMIELKQEINTLLRDKGLEAKYEIVE
ncbi:hypothetical protein JCM17960_32040 [Magnetospira thiophila]